ncbi:hypothetical protein IW492_14935 [Enterococcus sp. BWB1-3]|uniref:hypothetical protein n=1 Tax=Enterococcus sp. BWB1-3 TaxID=2787713 RepID=UPI001920FD65|nr:hypothetical protein [Enterococcus sp. BWB1-3]MBL1230524.1 hypothetical protein [Enterococcus sp. BWB1-3]
MEEMNKEVTNKEATLPVGVKWVSWIWLLNGGITAIMLILLIIESMSFGAFFGFGLVMGLLSVVIKIGPFICIYKRTPKMYDNLKIFFWLNVVLFVITTIMSFKVKVIVSIFLLFWFWSDLKTERTKAYFGYGEAAKAE